MVEKKPTTPRSKKVTDPKSTEPTPSSAPEPAPQSTPEKVETHDETDVAAALARKTQDGKGEEPVPEPDFQSFATEGVEKSNLLSVEDVTDQVLAGHWGSTAKTAANRLEAAGYDVDAVSAEFKRRKDRGAPSAF